MIYSKERLLIEINGEDYYFSIGFILLGNFFSLNIGKDSNERFSAGIVRAIE